MKTITRPRRSVLFVPAANARALEKSLTLGADAIIYDLEDSVADEVKISAREALAAHLHAHNDVPFERIIRINAVESAFGDDDVVMASLAHVDAVLVPKVERPQDVIDVARKLDKNDADETCRIWAMIETPRGILNADEVAQLGRRSSARLSTFVVGPNDIARESGIRTLPGRPYLVPWLMQIILAAKAGGLEVLDGVYNDFKDLHGFEAECMQGAAMGFDGKTLIHPSQIAGANAGFSPSAEEVARAKAILALFERAENINKGVASLDGEMIERLHLEMAKRVLAKSA
ncbi:HpcH/HpaI aldolase/citrate lyase family protein [Brucellaceae bacterium C25G]